MKVILLGIFTALFTCACGRPAIRTIENEDDGISKGLIDLSLSVCNSSEDCYDYHTDVSLSSYMKCINHTCLCYPCFLINTTSQKCTLDSCYEFSDTGECLSKQRSQTTAFILSAFLSSVGAANFYIDQNTLGIIQLSLLVFLVLLCCLCCCYTCCTLMCEECSCVSCCDIDESCCPLCVIITLLIAICLVIVSICCWWLIDLVVFGLNQRGDGSGCPLSTDL